MEPASAGWLPVADAVAAETKSRRFQQVKGLAELAVKTDALKANGPSTNS